MPRWSLALLAASALACATARRPAPSVAVYEADASAASSTRQMPEGCRLFATSGPMDQMESERATDDPYRRQRLETARRGGNVLLVLSERTVTRPNLECPSGDSSPECVRRGESWYRVRFEEYACGDEATRDLAERRPEAPRGGITIPLSSPKAAASTAVAPQELKTRLLEMIRARVASEVLLAYVRGQRLSRKMTAEEIIDWTRSGIPDAVIEAAATLR